ncbi:MAG: aminopeptidase N [Pseudorhodobacter sp.]|nr:aminopeptidase N [Pseudorhodobacter sp.]
MSALETTDAPQTIYLADYQPFTHIVEKVHLTFRLAPHTTRVLTRLTLSPNPARPGPQDLYLHGEGLKLIALAINGAALSVIPDATGLTIAAALLPQGTFTLESEVEIDPAANTALEGLYMSNGIYCTQCEAQGFRHITFYPDRPDVMAPFDVRIESDLPVLLSNGNPGGSGLGWAEWSDPWPKPAYLFALVAGDLVAHSDHFTTASGKPVDLNIWVRPGDETRCAYAMDSLIRSMRWDETAYGREYDLNLFNIVAVDDFNMGAMENKGLNIFNSKLVLASPETATDDDYNRIEGVIAHEYFHNWTGNRITCRDWFQLCLKEGLTVFRDQQFTGDMRSRDVKRIEDVLTLRGRQFREDGGPLAHPVRPESFIEINNFYTATVYEKGAEVIGMLKRLVGDADYARALDLYFDRHDGQAATIEDWLKVFEDTTGRDLTQFKRWYSEAGTPVVTVAEDWLPQDQGGTYRLTLTQKNPPTPGQPDKAPKVIPVAVGLLNPNGDEVLPTQVLELTETTQSFDFKDLATRPIPSLLRGFSAPVVLDRVVPVAERVLLLAHDTDAFNRFEAGRSLAREVLMAMIRDGAPPSHDLIQGLWLLARDTALDPAFRAMALRLPGEDEIAASLFAAGTTPDPQAIYVARKALGLAIARYMHPHLGGMEQALRPNGPFSPDAKGAGRRALRLACLGLLTKVDGGQAALAAYAAANNMTEELGSLAVLLDNGLGAAQLEQFHDRWQGERLVMDKWFGLQILMSAPDQTAALTEALTQHSLFDWKNPNRFRSVIGALSGNHAGFHHASGAGYRLLADWLIKLDPVNPQTAARMSTAFETWRRYDANRQALVKAELQRIQTAPQLSRDLGEMVSRMLG